MRTATILFALLISSVVFANDIIDYKVQGILKGNLDGKYAYLQIFSNKLQKSQFLVAEIRNRQFNFAGAIKCPANETCKARLFITNKPGLTGKDIVPLLKEVDYDYRHIVLEKKVVVEIDDKLRHASVKDGLMNEVNDEIEMINARDKDRWDSLEQVFRQRSKLNKDNKEEQRKDDAEFSRQVMISQDRRVEGLLAVASKYPNNQLAQQCFFLVSMINEKNSGRFQSQLEDTYVKMPQEFKESADGKKSYTSITETAKAYKLNNGYLPEYTFHYGKDSLSLNSYRGKYLFLDFWTSWCTPCRAEHLYMKQAYEKFKLKNFTILQISLDESLDKWNKAMAEEKLPWFNLRSEKGWDKELTKLFHVEGVPTNYLIGPDGKIIAVGLRGEELEKKLSELIK